MNPLQFTRSVRSLNRLRHIAQVLTQHGFGYIVAQINLTRFVPVWMMRKKPLPATMDDGASAMGRRLAKVCTELGPTFVKLGQMLSTRPDIVPPDVLTELSVLQDDVPPFPTSEAMQLIEQDMGRPAAELYDSIDNAPIASGSIGQVYRARGKDGADLVVKVRRPGIDDTIRLDMQLLTWLAESIENLLPELKVYRPTMLVHELDQMLTRELDYVNEAATTQRFAAAFADVPGVTIPRVDWDLSGPNVLTLEALPGDNLSTLLDQNAEDLDRPLIARRLVDAYLRQIFELGSFHTDPHPGNILIDTPAGVGLIDFGQVGSITDQTMTQLVILLYASIKREIDIVVDTLAEMGAIGPETDRQSLQGALRLLLDKYYGLPLKRVDLNTVILEFFDVVRRHDVVIPREAMQLSKAIGMVASVATRLDPDLNVLALLAPRLKRMARERLAPTRLLKEGGLWSWQLLTILRHAPSQVRDGLRRLSSGAWRLHLRHENLDTLTRELDRSSNRLAFSIVIAAIIVGSSVVVSADTSLVFFGMKVQYFGIVGYLVAGVLGLALSWAIFRSGRLH